MKIRIYRITTSGRAFNWERTEYFSLSPWAGDSYPYIGTDDGGTIYELPSQFEIRNYDFGFEHISSLAIYDNYYHITCTLSDSSGTPCIIDGAGDCHVLNASAVNDFFSL